MEKCVVTLPITPVANPSLGLVASILVGDIIARNLGLKFVLALGVQGMRIPVAELEGTVNSFLLHLNNVGVRPDYVWRSDSKENKVLLEKFFSKLTEDSFIEQAQVEVLECPCGAIEKLVDAIEWNEKRRLYVVRDGMTYCKICGGLSEKTQKIGHRFHLKENVSGIELHPISYEREVREQIRCFSEMKVLVSRKRGTAVSIKHGDEIVSLDPDFIWQMYLPALSASGFDPCILLGSNHTLRALILVRAVQQALSPKSSLRIVVPPYFLGEGRKRLGGESYSMNTLLLNHKINSLRVIVGMSLNWKQKESVIQTSQLALLDKMDQSFRSIEIQGRALPDIPAFFDQCNFNKIREAVGLVRRYKDIPKHNPLHGIINP